jgi:hypothetical protein
MSTTEPLRLDGELVAEAIGPGGASRDFAYDAFLTAEGAGAFARGGFIADPRSPEYTPEMIRNLEEVAESLAEWLPADAAARVFRAAYAGLTEYQIPEREAG